MTTDVDELIRAIEDLKYNRGSRSDYTHDEVDRCIDNILEIVRRHYAGRGEGDVERNVKLLQFIHDRLIHVHGENENVDYMHGLRRCIAAMGHVPAVVNYDVIYDNLHKLPAALKAKLSLDNYKDLIANILGSVELATNATIPHEAKDGAACPGAAVNQLEDEASLFEGLNSIQGVVEKCVWLQQKCPSRDLAGSICFWIWQLRPRFVERMAGSRYRMTQEGAEETVAVIYETYASAGDAMPVELPLHTRHLDQRAYQKALDEAYTVAHFDTERNSYLLEGSVRIGEAAGVAVLTYLREVMKRDSATATVDMKGLEEIIERLEAAKLTQSKKCQCAFDLAISLIRTAFKATPDPDASA